MEYGHGTVTEGTDCEHNDYYSKDGWWFCGHCHGFFSRRDDAKFCARLCKMEKERSDGDPYQNAEDGLRQFMQQVADDPRLHAKLMREGYISDGSGNATIEWYSGV